jgi:endonuclease VIII
VAEGDSIARLAARLDSVTVGRVITACDVRHPRFATVDLTAQCIVGWTPRGKHLLMRTDAGITVHSHLRMSGRWTVLGTGKRLPRAVAARLRIGLHLDDDRTLAGIDLPVLTVVRTGDEHQVVGHLGPDLLGPSTATGEGLARAAARVVAAGEQPVVAALLHQHRVAGLGNMWAQELLFLHGVDPWRPASATDPLPLLADARCRLRHAVDHNPAQNTTGRRPPGIGCTAAPGIPACAAPLQSRSPAPAAARTGARPGGARAASTDASRSGPRTGGAEVVHHRVSARRRPVARRALRPRQGRACALPTRLVLG